MIKIGLLGHGVVGSGVAEILFENADIVAANAGQGVGIAKILDLRDFSRLSYGKLFTAEADEVLLNPEVDIVVECMGGTEPARTFALKAIGAGKHFVTSNKALIAAHGEELFALAREKNVQLLYEASTGGGIPVIHPIRHCLGANRISRVIGILNGTTNFILTRMRDGGASFDTALAEAQALGYAEADPSADVDGADARRKICILAHTAFGAAFEDEKIPAKGIRGLHRDDMLYAMELNRAIRLLGFAETVPGGWTGRVWPTMLPLSHPLAHVGDVFNAVVAVGDKVGEVMFYGRGAGKDATASAVVSDIINIAAGVPARNNASSLPFIGDAPGKTRFFVRATGSESDRERIERMMPEALIVAPSNPALAGSFAIITGEGEAAELLARIDGLPVPTGERIRYEGA